MSVMYNYMTSYHFAQQLFAFKQLYLNRVTKRKEREKNDKPAYVLLFHRWESFVITCVCLLHSCLPIFPFLYISCTVCCTHHFPFPATCSLSHLSGFFFSLFCLSHSVALLLSSCCNHNEHDEFVNKLF